MVNTTFVPTRGAIRIVRAPDDGAAREAGERIEAHFRQSVVALWKRCKVAPQPRWLFEDMGRQKPLSAAQLFRAFALVAQSPEVRDADIQEAAESLVALLTALRPTTDASLETLVVAETEAQAAADVLQLHATITGGRCVTTAEKALQATARHAVAAKAVQRKLAAALGERFEVRRSTKAVAAKSR